MSTVTAILEADEDGTLRHPVPPELRNTKVRVTATLEAAAPTQPAEDHTPLRAPKELRKLGAFKEIGDPVDWQRAQRRDRPLPGRDQAVLLDSKILIYGAGGEFPALDEVLDRTDLATALTPRHVAWTELLRRVFEIDVLACPNRGGRLRSAWRTAATT